MKITKLIIQGDNRLTLGGSERIEYTPHQIFQVIIGTNGGGKTTLLYELSLLPPDPSFYKNGGMKEVHGEHNGNYYIARSTFNGSSAKHEFIKNGVNLNKGFTQTVQKELVKTETGVTPELHALLTDQIRFTTMTPQQRRNWITTFCPVDLTYANNIHQKAKTKLTHTVGALKQTKLRLSQETARLVELVDVDGIEDKIKIIRVLLDTLMARSTGINPDAEGVFQQCKKNIDQAEGLARTIIRNKKDKPAAFVGIYNRSDAEEKTVELKNQLAGKTASLKHLTDEYDQYQSLRSMASQGTGESEVFLKDKLTTVNEQILRLQHVAAYQSYKDVSRADVLLERATAFRLHLTHLLQDIRRAPFFMTPTDSVSFLESYAEEEKKLAAINNRIEYLEGRKEHIHLTEQHQCPSCNYKWQPGVSESELEEVNLRLQKGYSVRDEKTIYIRDNEDKVDSAKTMLKLHEAFRALLDEYMVISPKFEEIRWVDLDSQSGLVLAVVEEVIEGLTIARDIDLLKRDKDRLEDAIRHAELLHKAEELQQSSKYLDLEKRIHDLTFSIESLKENIRLAEGFIKHIQREDEQIMLLGKLWIDIIDGTKRYVDNIMEAEIQKDITLNQSALGSLQKKHNEKTMLENTIAFLEKEKSSLEVTEEAARLLIKMLSPTEGIIAEQLYNSILVIVKLLNKVIAPIWTYSLVVKPCSIENDDLDYRFPMMIEHPGVMRSDVSKGSSSMKDIVDYAFKRAAYVLMDLKHYPLFLDEFGRTFDPEHLNRTMHHIQNQAEIGEYSQIFLISHFENYYSGFPNSDITLLHNGNVKLTIEHNQCIQIT